MKLLFRLFFDRAFEPWNEYWIRRDWLDYKDFRRFAKSHRLWSPDTSMEDQQFASTIATEFLGVKRFSDIKYAIWLRT